MSSYRGMDGGAWDGGPPGAEGEYAAARGPYSAPTAPPHSMPATDPWTGVSYSQYGPPASYDYGAYGTPGYTYNYDTNYYHRPDGNYDKYSGTYPHSQQGNYGYPPRQVSRPVNDSRTYEQRRSYRSNSRSVSPYEKVKRDTGYSRRKDSYDEERRRSRSRSQSLRSKHAKYSSSDRSSSRSPPHSSMRKYKQKKRSSSSSSSRSEKSYKRKYRENENSPTPLSKKHDSSRSRSSSKSRSHQAQSKRRSHSLNPSQRSEIVKGKGAKSHTSKDLKGKEKRSREVITPPKKRIETPPKGSKKSDDRCSISPPKRYKKVNPVTPPKNSKHKSHKSPSPLNKRRESSLTPPRSYARRCSSSESRSRSRSYTPKLSKRDLRTPKSDRSRSNSVSSHSSASSRHSHSISRHMRRKSSYKHNSRSKSRSKSPSSRSRSKSRSNSRPKKSKCDSHSSHSRSRSGSDDDRRGQFTVADRKKFWQLHRSRIEEKKEKSPPKEIKPPPGVVEGSLDDIQYGDPPEVEGPNFAELLPSPNELLASTAKSKTIPIPIKNDGSFLEMFKKMQEETKEIEEKKPEIKKPMFPFIGKRRGGRVLKTGLVKKPKAIDEQPADNNPKDAWSLYMQEVKKYRETSCEEERKTRPLVK